jgi:DNA mismatch repair protein MSH4
MNMLYKIAEGAVKETHYGFALARLVPLPRGVMEHGENVSRALEEIVQKNKRKSAGVIRERRRKLILNLKEHLVQARNGVMEGEILAAWLREPQKEFVLRMAAIDEEASRLEEESEEDESKEGQKEDEESDLPDAVSEGEFDDNEEDQIMQDVKMEPEPETSRMSFRHPSVITLDSIITGTSESLSAMRAVSENER